MSDLEEGELIDSDGEDELRAGAQAGARTEPAGVVPPNTPNIGSGPEMRLNSIELSRATSSYLYRSDKNAVCSSSDSNSADSDDDRYVSKRKKQMQRSAQRGMDLKFRNPLLEKEQLSQTTKPKTDSMMESVDSATMDTNDRTMNPTMNAKKRKINNVWGTVLDEQTLTSNLGGFGVVKDDDLRQQSDRNVEFYDYTNRELDDRPDLEDSDILPNQASDDPFESVVVEPDSDDNGRLNRKRTMADRIGRKNAKSRLGLRSYDKSRSRTHIEASPDDSINKVVNCIINNLNEKKVHLIARIVEKIGKKKALELLYETEDVELRGGMMTMDLSRRRTPGGVYLQLLKTDPNVTDDDLKEIFEGEMTLDKKQRKRYKKAQRAAWSKQHHDKSKEPMQTADKGIDDAENKCHNDGNVETRMAEQEEDVESDLDNENKSMELEVM